MDEAGPLADLDAAGAAAERVVAGIGAGQWELPTPCDGVDVRSLVSHLVVGNLAFAALVNETAPPDGDADHLGEDPLGAFRASAARLLAALGTPGLGSRTFTLPVGRVPGAELVRIRITEYLGHGWDLARATGQPPGFPDDVAERGLAEARRQLRGRSPGEHAGFADEKPVPAGTAAIDRLAAFLGRTV
jgi:uncharacterized protein (TIGR03086 family)